jgi:hypothetical protein
MFCAIIVLGTAAGVISDWGDGEVKFTNIGVTVQNINFYGHPQSYVNIALFTAILSLLLCSMLIIGMHVISKKGSGPTAKDVQFLGIMELISVILLWIFWFTSIITTTMLADDAFSSSTMKACCAFCWFSWFSITASLVVAIMSMVSGKKPAAAPALENPPSTAQEQPV